MVKPCDKVVYYCLEDMLKRRYMDLISLLEKGTQDEMEYYRSKVMTHVAELLEERAEGEQVLLSVLINKLADNVRKVASKVQYLRKLSQSSQYIS
jgi:hypothetical protein